MANVFISYRREDAAPYAGRICDRLAAEFGEHSIFMDVQDIRPGQDFAQTIDETIQGCAALLVVIGPRWLEIMKARERSGEDFVRHEIAAGIRHGITIVPVLVNGAAMPQTADLPRDLAPLSRHQALSIRDDRFDDDVAELTQALHTVHELGSQSAGVRSSRMHWKLLIPLIAAGLAIAILVITRPRAPNLRGNWVADMQSGNNRQFRIRMNLERVEDRIVGTVNYPSGDATIQDGKIKGDTFNFRTVHVPQFEALPTTIKVEGQVEGEELRLIVTTATSVSTGTAHRSSAREP
jgi:hypothetical protein